MMFLTAASLVRSRLVLATGVAVLTAVQGLANIAGRSERWVGHWPSTSAAVGWSTLWGTCIAAGAAAWVVSAPRRDGYHHMLRASSRSQGRILQGGLLAVLAGSLVGYGIVVVYAMWLTAARATHGGPDVLEFLTLLAAAPMAVGVGAAVGRMIRASLAPVVAAVTTYAMYVGILYIEIYTGQPVFVDLLWVDYVDRTYLRLPAELLVARPTFWAAVGAALLSWTVGANRIAYVSTVLASFAASAMLLTGGARIDAANEYAAICSDSRPRVCVDRAHRHLLNEYRDRVITGVARIRGLDLSDITVVQGADLFSNSLRYTGTDPGGGRSRQLVVPIIKRNTAVAHEIAGRTFAANLGFAIFLSECLVAPQGSSRAERTDTGLKAATLLYRWWLTVNNLPTNGTNFVGDLDVASMISDDASALRYFVTLSDNARTAWFAEQGERILSCTATLPA